MQIKLTLATIAALALSSCGGFDLPGGEGKATLGYYKPTSNLDPEGRLGLFIERAPAAIPAEK